MLIVECYFLLIFLLLLHPKFRRKLREDQDDAARMELRLYSMLLFGASLILLTLAIFAQAGQARFIALLLAATLINPLVWDLAYRLAGKRTPFGLIRDARPAGETAAEAERKLSDNGS